MQPVKKDKIRFEELDILNILKNFGPRFLNQKQIAKYLSQEKGFDLSAHRNALTQYLELLFTQGKLMRDEKWRYQVKPAEEFVEGKLDFTQKGSAYLVVDGLDEDIFIPSGKTGTAMNGDTVKVLSSLHKKGKPEGAVVEVLERAKTQFAGRLDIMKGFAFMVPDDPKVPSDFYISLSNIGKATNGQKVLVEMVRWKEGQKNPEGKVVQVLGNPGDNDTEMNSILAEYGFPLKFPAEVEKEAAKIPTTLSTSEIKKRKDFRKITTFTIDPVDAKDFDDALSFRELGPDLYEVGVHIADVTFYLPEGSLLDQEAFERATSVYLVDRVIPMLPEKLSNVVCSLRPHEDKYCYSAVFEMNSNGDIMKEWFGRTVIHSIHRFTYEEAQTVIETKKGPLSQEVLKLDSIAKTMRAERMRRGAISFEKPEVKFRLDDKGNPIGVYLKENKDSNKLIEEFMLLANRKVAEFVGKQTGVRKTFVYRVHDVPVADKLSAFSEFAGKFGYKVKTGTNKEIAQSLNKLLLDVAGKKEQNVLEQLAIRTMAKAIYTTENIGHYGLAFDYYSHFTSPIRRYPDVMVHRLLSHYLNDGKSVSPKTFESHCKHSTDMEIRASSAERDSVKFKQVQYLKKEMGKVFDGIISGVTEWGIYVEITENKCEGMIRLRDLKDDMYFFDEKNFCVTGKRKNKKFQLGDSIRVKVARADVLKKQVDLEVV